MVVPRTAVLVCDFGSPVLIVSATSAAVMVRMSVDTIFLVPLILI